RTADDPGLAAMQATFKQASMQAAQVIEKLTGELAAMKLQKKREDERTVIDGYGAKTDRIKVVAPALSSQQVSALIRQVLAEAGTTNPSPSGQEMNAQP